MKLNQSHSRMAPIDNQPCAVNHAPIASRDTNKDQHVKWLADWRKALDASTNATDGSTDECCEMELAQELSVLLATTPATSRAGLVAQIEWFRDDLGGYVFRNALPAHDAIFDTLTKSASSIDV